LRSTWAVAASSAMRARASGDVVNQEALGRVVPAVEGRSQVAQVEGDVVRRQVGAALASMSG
jgi:hypothetical protein